jgi:hypothetical protein
MEYYNFCVDNLKIEIIMEYSVVEYMQILFLNMYGIT